MRRLVAFARMGLALAAVVAGCSSAQPSNELRGVHIAVLDTSPRAPRGRARELPPPPGRAREPKWPRPVWATLPSGLSVGVVESHALPIVELRVVALGGRSAEGDRPGVAALTAAMLEQGGAGSLSARARIARVESLGAKLSVEADDDRITLGVGVTSDQLEEALSLLGSLAIEPTMTPGDFRRIQAHLVEDRANAAVEDGEYGASLMLRRGLFQVAGGAHPYALAEALQGDLARLRLEDCRAFFRRSFAPATTFVLVVGDTSVEAVKAAVERAFARHRGEAPNARSIPAPLPLGGRRIVLVDRPGSEQSEIFLGALGPARADPGWAAFAVMNQVLGGKGTGRLFMDVRERLSLAYVTSSRIEELASGPSTFQAFSVTRTARTGLALEALLGHLDRIAREPASEEEIASAKRFLELALATRFSRLGAVADELVKLRTLGLPEDHVGRFRQALEAVTPAEVSDLARRHLGEDRVMIAVAGDAAIIGPMLSHFGAVEVVDAAKGFAPVRTVAANPSAPLGGEAR
jgi:zinc protease